MQEENLISSMQVVTTVDQPVSYVESLVIVPRYAGNIKSHLYKNKLQTLLNPQILKLITIG